LNPFARKRRAVAELQKILDRYAALCTYCDSFWSTVFRKYPGQCACTEGCSVCCELSSVNLLEAVVIARHCVGTTRTHGALPRKSSCPFLTGGRCAIYPSRPLICRTHGLLLRSPAFTGRFAATCPFNFATIDHDLIDGSAALDIEAVTNSLAKLNAACCMLLGDIGKSAERVALADLAAGRFVLPARFVPAEETRCPSPSRPPRRRGRVRASSPPPN
jgi:Fe-S-cluster containining protein